MICLSLYFFSLDSSFNIEVTVVALLVLLYYCYLLFVEINNVMDGCVDFDVSCVFNFMGGSMMFVHEKSFLFPLSLSLSLSFPWLTDGSLFFFQNQNANTKPTAQQFQVLHNCTTDIPIYTYSIHTLYSTIILLLHTVRLHYYTEHSLCIQQLSHHNLYSSKQSSQPSTEYNTKWANNYPKE